MKAEARPLTGLEEVNWAAGMCSGRPCYAPLDLWVENEHSPLRAYIWQVQLEGIPSKTSTHLVRHKIGVEHFVQSNRGKKDDEITRQTPVDVGMILNAQALINMAHERLCYKSSLATIAAMVHLVKAVQKHDPVLAKWMVPKCVYLLRCPEARECTQCFFTVFMAYTGIDLAAFRGELSPTQAETFDQILRKK